MAVRSLAVSTGSEPSSKTAGQRNASSDSAHKKSPRLGGLQGFLVDGALLTVKVNSSPDHCIL